LSLRLIRETHEVLMRKVRGGGGVKTPGAVRTSQNWIAGRSPVDAVFVPPPVPEMQEALGQLERSFHPPIFHQYPDLISVGLIHSQFETIHPFLDGNGRMGRLLITFLLCDHKVLDHPLLYLSIYFNRNRKAYYEHLQAVRDEGAWEPWLHFFLIGVSEVAREATTMAHQIVVLRESLRTRITDQLKSRASNGLRVLEALFGDPVVDVKKVEKLLGCSQPTALHLVDDLHGMGLLRELTGRRRGRIFLFRPYVDLFQASGG
jgi:Fic family protein